MYGKLETQSILQHSKKEVNVEKKHLWAFKNIILDFVLQVNRTR